MEFPVGIDFPVAVSSLIPFLQTNNGYENRSAVIVSQTNRPLTTIPIRLLLRLRSLSLSAYS
jgi:hypothetical protein